MKNKTLGVSALFALIFGLSGCAATQTLVSKGRLDVQTKMSESLFLDPVDNEKLKKVFVVVRNASDKQGFEVAEDLKKSLLTKGYQVVPTQKQAQYLLQVNVLQVGKMDPSAAEAAMYKGYGYDGMAIGAGTAMVAGGNTESIFAGGLLGGLVSVVADSAVKDVTYAMITDVQIKERNSGKSKVEHVQKHFNRSGTSGGTFTTFTEKSDWKIYQTRILSSANKANLSFDQAAPALRKALADSIAGIF